MLSHSISIPARAVEHRTLVPADGHDPVTVTDDPLYIQAGVTVVIKGRALGAPDDEGFFRIIAGDHRYRVNRSSVSDVEPQPLSLKDIVEAEITEEVMGKKVVIKRLGIVIGIDGPLTWVRYDNGARGFHDAGKLTLKHIHF